MSISITALFILGFNASLNRTSLTVMLSAIMLNVVLPSVLMLDVNILSAVMLNAIVIVLYVELIRKEAQDKYNLFLI